MSLDFGDVASDSEFVSRATELESALADVRRHVELGERYRRDPAAMTLEDRIDHDLYSLYALNSLAWIDLKLRGVDPNSHQVKTHLAKVRQLMQAKRDLVDRRSRPQLDKGAAQRFVRNGLWDPNAAPVGAPLNKKIKFDDDDDPQ